MRKYGKAFIFLRRPERWCFEFLKGESKRALWVLILAWETLELWPTKILKFAFILLDLLQKKVLRLSPFSNQMDSLISDYQRTDCTNSHYTYHLKSQPGKRQPYTRGALSFMPYGENVIRSDDKRSWSIFVTLTCEGWQNDIFLKKKMGQLGNQIMVSLFRKVNVWYVNFSFGNFTILTVAL